MSVVMANGETRAHKKVLLQAFKECNRTKSGSYDIVYRHKFPFQEEIESITGHCTFSKLPSDEVLGARVILATPEKGEKDKTTYLHDGQYEVIVCPEERQFARVSDLYQCSPHYVVGGIASGVLFKPLLPISLFEVERKSTLP
jgi:hypothetical protein